MASRYRAFGEPRPLSNSSIQEERSNDESRTRWRITFPSTSVVILTTDELFELTEALDDFCDELEDSGA